MKKFTEAEQKAKRNEYMKVYRFNNAEKEKEKEKERKKKYYLASPEKFKELARKYRLANPEKVKEGCKKYRQYQMINNTEFYAKKQLNSKGFASESIKEYPILLEVQQLLIKTHRLTHFKQLNSK